MLPAKHMCASFVNVDTWCCRAQHNKPLTHQQVFEPPVPGYDQYHGSGHNCNESGHQSLVETIINGHRLRRELGQGRGAGDKFDGVLSFWGVHDELQ